MSTTEAPAPKGELAPRGRTLLLGARGGLLVWLVLAVGGQLLAAAGAAIVRAFRPGSWVELGLLHALASVRVDLAGRVAPPAGAPLEGVWTGEETIRASVALGAGTIVATVLLFRAGRAALTGRPGHRRGASVAIAIAAAALAVATGFALPLGLSSFAIELRIPAVGVDALRPVRWQAFAFPFALGVVAAGIGAIAASVPVRSSSIGGRRIGGAARGGWHAAAWVLALAVLGSFVVAALHPAVTSAYGRALAREGPGGAVVAMYHAALLPNQAVDVVAISLGGRVDLVSGDDRSTVSVRGIDVDEGPLRLLVGDRRRVPFGVWSIAFFVVPALASVAGGRRAAAGARGRRERVLRGALGGVVFGVLVGVAAWAASVELASGRGPILAVGADPWRTGVLGLAWGVTGGAIGGLLRDPPGTAEEPPRRAQEPEGLPSDTSLK